MGPDQCQYQDCLFYNIVIVIVRLYNGCGDGIHCTCTGTSRGLVVCLGFGCTYLQRKSGEVLIGCCVIGIWGYSRGERGGDNKVICHGHTHTWRVGEGGII